MKSWNRNNMRERRYTILSTASLPFERLPDLPDSVEVRMIPFIEIKTRQDPETKSKIVALATEKLTVIFTSAQAVKAVKSTLQQKPDWDIYCVGKETSSSIEQEPALGVIKKTAANAKALSEILISEQIKKALFFCGNQRMDILPENLLKQGIHLTELIVYETRLTPVHLEEQTDAVLFFSPTAVKSFFSMNELSPGATAFAMGTTTAATLKQFTKNPVIISTESDKAFVLQTALEYAGSHPIT
jgi:uroporphyrinogen-III synthase